MSGTSPVHNTAGPSPGYSLNSADLPTFLQANMFAEILVKHQHERMWTKSHRNHSCSQTALELPQPLLPPSPLGLSLPKGVRVTWGRCGLQAEQRGLHPAGLGRCLCGEPRSPAVAEGSRASPPSLRMEFAPKILLVSPQLLSTVEEGATPTLKHQLPVLGISSIFLQFYCDHYSNYYLLLYIVIMVNPCSLALSSPSRTLNFDRCQLSILLTCVVPGRVSPGSPLG